MRIAMIGTGYVGLVSGACFADFGHRVTCVDTDASKIDALNRGNIPIFEPDLDRLVEASVSAGRLDFTTDIAGPVGKADAVFIAVGTPSRRGDGHADLTYVHAAARDIAKALQGFTVVVTKSTVPVGTGDEVERIIRETNPQADVAVASNPEFLREARRSATSSTRTALWSAPRMSARARCSAKSTGRCISIRRRSCTRSGARRN
jgi:UDPglucose 6-dehydrogenase